MKTSKILLGIVAATVLGLGAAHATQINGSIGFTSSPNSSGGTVTQLGGNTTVTFNNPLHVDFVNGDYLGVPSLPPGPVAQDVNFASITFDSSGNLVSSNVPEWTFTVGGKTYSFDLLSLSTASFHNGGISGLVLMGEGMAHITGFDATPSIFSLQATGTHLTFAILQPSNTSVPGVPESGSALALLGLSLIAVEGLRRKLKFATA